MTTARQRVDAVVAVARRIADAHDELGRTARTRLPATSGLSREGVELALTQHFEPSPDDRELALLQRRVAPAARCHVVLAANVCTAPLRAIVCALVASDEVFVKPSRRDPVVAELLVQGLGWPSVQLVKAITPRAGDTVHVYGSDPTIASMRQQLPADVTLVAHGTGIGVAVCEAEVDGVADDLVAFDGRGCLSPRLVLTSGDARDVGRRLHAALTKRGNTVPRGELTIDDRAALRAAQQTFAAVGDAHIGEHHAVFVDPAPEALALVVAARTTVVAQIGDAALVEVIAPHVAALGGDAGPLLDSVTEVCPRARRSPLGRMQHPPLDGPVDLR